MMMPFALHDMTTVPPGYRAMVTSICDKLYGPPGGIGVAYLTVDEARLRAGEHHRRPGLHVDGVGAWGGGGGGWGASGFVLACTVQPPIAWTGRVKGWPGPDGDCSDLAAALPRDGRRLATHEAYLCGPLLVHASTPMGRPGPRQFLRISLPNICPWFEGYSESPYGVKPTGPILPRRVAMEYRP
jgi:hypothetical protein